MPDTTHPPVVAADAVYYRYPGSVAADDVLRGASLDVAAGEIVLLRGHSGSGKTTLLSVLAGLLSPARGTVTVTGADLGGLDRGARARLRLAKVGFVFQRFQLIAALRARENVELVLRAGGVSPRDARRRALETLDALGLGAKAERYPRELSGGEQQRVSIARAVVNHPPLLVCDEPTGNLDPDTSVGIMQLLYRINRAGTTILMVTHDREMVDKMRKRVIALEDGRLARDERRGGYTSE